MSDSIDSHLVIREFIDRLREAGRTELEKRGFFSSFFFRNNCRFAAKFAALNEERTLQTIVEDICDFYHNVSNTEEGSLAYAVHSILMNNIYLSTNLPFCDTYKNCYNLTYQDIEKKAEKIREVSNKLGRPSLGGSALSLVEIDACRIAIKAYSEKLRWHEKSTVVQRIRGEERKFPRRGTGTVTV